MLSDCKIFLYIRLPEHGRVETTAGRLIFNNALFPELWQYEQKKTVLTL